MILIRNCEGFDELEACVEMQVETWGYDQADIIPRKAFLVMLKVGGQLIGAFDTSLPGSTPNGDAHSLIGFAMSLPGVKPGKNFPDGQPRPYLHSHMLAVRGGVPKPGNWRATQAGSTPRRPRPRNPAHGMDLRSPRNQKRILKYPQAGRSSFHISP